MTRLSRLQFVLRAATVTSADVRKTTVGHVTAVRSTDPVTTPHPIPVHVSTPSLGTESIASLGQVIVAHLL